MDGQQFKHLANHELDVAAQRVLGRLPTDDERYTWWTTPKAGVAEPYLLVIGGADKDKDAVIQAAREWDGS